MVQLESKTAKKIWILYKNRRQHHLSWKWTLELKIMRKILQVSFESTQARN